MVARLVQQEEIDVVRSDAVGGRHALDVGGETEIVLRADGLDDVATCSVLVAAAIVSPSGELLPAFEERALGAFRTVSETTNGAVFTLRWADVALELMVGSNSSSFLWCPPALPPPSRVLRR